MTRFLVPLVAFGLVVARAPAAEPLQPTIPLLAAPTFPPAGVLAVSPDSRWAALYRWPYPATGKPPLTIQFWDLKTGAMAKSVAVAGDRLWDPKLWSPDSRLLTLRVVRGEGDKQEVVLIVIDAATGKFREYPNLKVLPVGFTADGSGLYAHDAPAYTGKDSKIALWSLTDGKRLREFTVQNLRRFTLAPDGKTAHHYTDSARHEVWDFEAGKRVATLAGEGMYREARHEFLGFARGGAKVVTVLPNWRVWVFDSATGKLEREVDVPDRDTAYHLRGVANDLSCVLVETHDRDLVVFEPGKDRGRVIVPAIARNLYPRAFLSPDGRQVFREHPEYGPQVFDTATGRLLHTLRPDTQQVRSLAFAADGKTLVAAVANQPGYRSDPGDPPAGHLLVWDTATGALRKGIPGIDAAVCAAHPTPDGTKAVALLGTAWRESYAWGPQAAELWDLTSGRRLKTIATEKDGPYGFVASPDGRRLAAVVIEKRREGDAVKWVPLGTRVWNLATGDHERDLPAAPDTYVLSFTADGERLLFLSRKSTVESWGIESGKSRMVFNAPTVVYGHSGGAPFVPHALPNGDAFVSLLGPGTNVRGPIRLYTDNRQIAFGRIDMRPGPLAVSRDGKWAAASERPYVGPARVFVWKIPDPPPLDEKTIKDGAVRPEEAWVEPTVLHGHTGQIHAVAFSPDGKTLVTGGEDCAIRVWEVATGRLKATLWAPPAVTPGAAPADWVAYTPDGFFAGTVRGRAFLYFEDADPLAFLGFKKPAPTRTAGEMGKEFLSPATVREALGVK